MSGAERVVSGAMCKRWVPTIEILDRVLVTGETVKGTALLMVCKENGKKIFRRPTPEEEADYVSSDAW